MRTDKEIIERVNAISHSDFFGFESADLITCLPFNSAKPFLKEGVTEEEWQPDPRDRESVLKRMVDYMPFAWEKANNERGISAGRSMSHYSAWIWLAGDDLGNLNRYNYYGKDNLVKICEFYGWDSSQWDDGIRRH